MKAATVGAHDLWLVLAYSVIPAILAVVLATAFSGIVNHLRIVRARTVRPVIPVTRYSQYLVGYSLALAAGSLVPSILALYKDFEIRVVISQSAILPLAQGVVGFVLGGFIVIGLVVMGMIAYAIDFRAEPGRAWLLTSIENAVGGGILVVVLFYLLMASRAS